LEDFAEFAWEGFNEIRFARLFFCYWDFYGYKVHFNEPLSTMQTICEQF